jgi:hypothetical protein
LNAWKILSFVTVSIFALSAILASCSSPLSESDQAQIYASVIKQLYQEQRGGSRTGYITRYTYDEALPEHNSKLVSEQLEEAKRNSRLLSESLQKAISNELAGTQKTYIWVTKASEIPHDVIMGPLGGGCQIVLGNIYVQEDDSVQVSSYYLVLFNSSSRFFYCLSSAAGGPKPHFLWHPK